MDIIYFLKEAMLLIVILSAPALIVTTVVGLVVSMFQAIMQLQDQALPFSIKVLAITVTLLLTGRWMGEGVLQLCQTAFTMIEKVGH